METTMKKHSHFGVEELKSYFNEIREARKFMGRTEEYKKAVIEVEAKRETELEDNIIDVEPTKVEPLKGKAKSDKDNVITMAERKICPVEVLTTPSKNVKIDIRKKEKEIDENLNKFINESKYLKGIVPNSIKRTSTGLVEVQLFQNNGNIVTISIDIDNKIYGTGYMVFFIGKVIPLSEYNSRPIILNDTTLNSIINGVQIDPKYYVPENLVILNRLVDMTTLKENDKEKREKVLIKTARAFETLNDEIVQTAAGEPFRFAFAKYKSPDKFTLVSSKRNLVSNLSDEKLKTDKELWIEVEKDVATLKYTAK